MTSSASPIEQKIEKAKQKVVKTKEKYDASVEELKKLMDKRDSAKKDEILAAIVRSNKSYDEILEFINNNTRIKE